ncbi:UNVERIFIED_CONTAM: hypothetical protein FKN15_026332 [Acipenser sinensis]
MATTLLVNVLCVGCYYKRSCVVRANSCPLNKVFFFFNYNFNTGNLQFSGSEDDWQPPPANQRVEAGCAKFQNVMLAPPPTNYRAFLVMDELEKQKAAKKPAGRASSEKLTSSLDRSADSRSNIVSHVGGNSKSSLADSVNVRAGEYVIMVQDVTSPPFLNHPLPPAFVLLRVIPPKNGKNSKIDKSGRKESK